MTLPSPLLTDVSRPVSVVVIKLGGGVVTKRRPPLASCRSSLWCAMTPAWCENETFSKAEPPVPNAFACIQFSVTKIGRI